MSFTMRHACTLVAAVASLLMAPCAHAQQATGTLSVKQLTPETALAAAQAALAQCRKAGFQVSVAVVDRSGVLQVLLRDRFAGPHTVDAAMGKAWTAASFRMDSGTLATETQPGKPMSGLRQLPQVVAVAGGRPVEAGGSVLGGLGVSGAPGGDADDACAQAGLKAIIDALEF